MQNNERGGETTRQTYLEQGDAETPNFRTNAVAIAKDAFGLYDTSKRILILRYLQTAVHGHIIATSQTIINYRSKGAQVSWDLAKFSLGACSGHVSRKSESHVRSTRFQNRSTWV